MKTRKILLCGLAIVLFMAAFSACQQGGPHTAELRGAVQNGADGLYVRSGGKLYHIEGQDLTAMVGKMVTINGTVSESNGKYTISVTSFAEK